MPAGNNTQHDSDFYQWAISTDVLIRSGQMHDIDHDALAEEVETFACTKEEVLDALYRRLIYSFLLQTLQIGLDQAQSISSFRQKIAHMIKQNPSLLAQSTDAEFLQRTYKRGVFDVYCATGVPENEFPPTCPYSLPDLVPNHEELMPASLTAAEDDPHLWAVQTGEQLRARSLSEVDWEQVRHVLDSLIRSERRQLLVPMALKISYMLRLDFQYVHDSLTEHTKLCRSAAGRHLWDMEQVFRISPSLRNAVPELLDEAYHMGRMFAADSARTLTQFDFPMECCYTVEELLDWSELDN